MEHRGFLGSETIILSDTITVVDMYHYAFVKTTGCIMQKISLTVNYGL